MKKTALLQLALASLILVSGTAYSADKKRFPDIEKLMTEEEYQASGLDKLSAKEREALNRWLLRYTANEAPVIRKQNPEVKKVEAQTRIVANIIPPFKGWDGKTVFRLDNGQIWKQRLSGRHRYRGDNYQVVIKKNILGFYQMKLVDSGASIGVKRIQ